MSIIFHVLPPFVFFQIVSDFIFEGGVSVTISNNFYIFYVIILSFSTYFVIIVFVKFGESKMCSID